MQRLFVQCVDWRIQRKAVFFAERGKIHIRDRTRFGVAPARCTDRPLPDGQLFIRDDPVGIDPHLLAQSGTDRTRAVRIIEGEHARRQLFDRNAAVITRIILRKGQRLSADHIRNDQTARQGGRRFDRICDASARIRPDDHTVHHDLNVVLERLFQLDFLGKVAHLTVHPHTDIARFARVLQHLSMLALLAADDRRKDLYARFFLQRHQPVDNLIDGLLMDLLAAPRTVRRTDPRPEQTHIVIDLGHCADR